MENYNSFTAMNTHFHKLDLWSKSDKYRRLYAQQMLMGHFNQSGYINYKVLNYEISLLSGVQLQYMSVQSTNVG